MAELAMGGIQLTVRTRGRSGQCRHETSLAVRAVGVERSICETCGHISVRFLSELAGPVFRRRFARPADVAADSPSVNPFSDMERLGITRRQDTQPPPIRLSA